MKLYFSIAIIFLYSISNLNAQRVVDMTGSAQLLDFAASLGRATEGSPLANPQKRTPMMYKLYQLVKDDDGITRTYVGAEVGSAYENESFLPGKVYYNDENLGNVYYRLNAYNNEIEIKTSLNFEEKQLALIKNQEVRLVATNVELHYLQFYDAKEKLTEAYLTLLKEGAKYTLFRRAVKKFTEPRAAANSMVNSIPSRFTDYTEYYFKEQDSETIRELPIHKKRTATLFPSDIRPDIENYIKESKPDVDSETDVLMLFNFIDSLY